MKQIVHSLWTLPMLSGWRGMDGAKQLLINLYLYTISAWYIKKWGGKIDLYSDSMGLWILEHAPYDIKFLSFEEIDYQTLPCWATPKMLVMDFIKTPFTHIDGDVLIKSQRVFDEITDKNYDLTVEGCIDDTNDLSHFILWHKDYFETNTSFSNDFNYLQTCNCGCVTINNEQLKKEYVDKYFEYRKELFDNQDKINLAWEYDTFVPDLMIEQMNLYQVSKKYKRKGLVNTLVNSNNSNMYDIFKPKFTDEYRHYAGVEKGHMSIEYFRNMLQQLDSKLYQKTREKESELRNYLLIENEI